MRVKRWIPLCLVLLVAVLVLTAGAAESTVSIQILGINDFHGAILQTGKVSGRPAGGAAALAAWLKEREAANPYTLMVSAGDAVGASQPISALLQDEPTIECMNLTGFDLGVPGNHDFDESYAEMLRLYGGGFHAATGYFPGASFPLVLANVIESKTKQPLLPPYKIISVAGVPLGFIGVITRETPSIVMAGAVQGLEFLDPAASINKYVPKLRQKGVEAVIVLAHEGGTFARTAAAIFSGTAIRSPPLVCGS